MHYAAKLMLLCATPSADKGFITNFQAKQLPYLQAIVRESLRISPPVVGLFPRDVLPEERWLKSDPAKLAVMNRTNELIFNYGKFQCLGRAIAQTEIGKTVFELLRNFDITLNNPARPWKVVNMVGMLAISDLWVQIIERVPGERTAD
ncbi:cytochrome p450 [Hirsutella rhossiliensis]